MRFNLTNFFIKLVFYFSTRALGFFNYLNLIFSLKFGVYSLLFVYISLEKIFKTIFKTCSQFRLFIVTIKHCDLREFLGAWGNLLLSNNFNTFLFIFYFPAEILVYLISRLSKLFKKFLTFFVLVKVYICGFCVLLVFLYGFMPFFYTTKIYSKEDPFLEITVEKKAKIFSDFEPFLRALTVLKKCDDIKDLMAKQPNSSLVSLIGTSEFARLASTRIALSIVRGMNFLRIEYLLLDEAGGKDVISRTEDFKKLKFNLEKLDFDAFSFLLSAESLCYSQSFISLLFFMKKNKLKLDKARWSEEFNNFLVDVWMSEFVHSCSLIESESYADFKMYLPATDRKISGLFSRSKKLVSIVEDPLFQTALKEHRCRYGNYVWKSPTDSDTVNLALLGCLLAAFVKNEHVFKQVFSNISGRADLEKILCEGFDFTPLFR